MAIDIGTTACLKVPEQFSRSEAARLQRDLEKSLADRPGIVVLDCSSLQRVSAGHVSGLCAVHKYCEEAGVAVRLASVSVGLSRVLEVLDLDKLFDSDSGSVQGSRRIAGRWAAQGFRRMYVDQFRGDVEDVSRSSESFLCYLKSLQLSEMVVFELQTVFYEISMNIAAHANTNDDERIVFTAEADDTGITMVFTDSGDPFDPTGHEADFEPQSAGKDRRKRGLGITMVRRLTDNMTYCRKRNSVNVLKVKKNWS